MAKGKLAIGALVGAVAGFVTGVLMAPKSGKETRDDIKNKAMEAKGAATQEAAKVKKAAESKVEEAKAWGEEVVGDVTNKATDLKGRTEQAIEGAKKGFSTKPKTQKKK